jgi:hypothetical protein
MAQERRGVAIPRKRSIMGKAINPLSINIVGLEWRA